MANDVLSLAAGILPLWTTHRQSADAPTETYVAAGVVGLIIATWRADGPHQAAR